VIQFPLRQVGPGVSGFFSMQALQQALRFDRAWSDDEPVDLSCDEGASSSGSSAGRDQASRRSSGR